MDDIERQELARRLSALSPKDVRKELRRLDPAADMKFFRNSVWDEYQTLYVLPNAGIGVTVVEKADVDEMNAVVHSSYRDQKKEKVSYHYVEARVASLDSRRAPKR